MISSVLVASALSKEDIAFPVNELGGCSNEIECKQYCDDPGHIESCISFAEKYNLMSKEEAEYAKKFIAAGSVGPGGCISPDSCEAYCNDVNNINECLEFAERTGILPPQELEEARKVQAALAAGAQLPGGCRNKDECDAYCENPDHMEECIAFGEAAGFIPPDELAEARKVLAAIKRGVKPPPCRGKAECDAYCSQPEHMEACLTFAQEAGLIPPDELEDAKKMLTAIKKGVRPPPCGGKDECDVYCGEESHFEECLNFAEAAGFIAPEEAEMARKTGGKGPGGCMGREECEAFCENPDNQQICFNFAREHDLLSQEDLRQMEEGKQQLLQGIDNAPPEVKSCLENIINIEGLRSGAVMPTEDMGGAMRSCFEQFMPKPEEFGPPGFEEGMMPLDGMMPPPPGEFQPPEGELPEGFQPPAGFEEEFKEQFQQQYQQEFEKRYQEEYERRMQEQMQMPAEFQPPPPSSRNKSPSLFGLILAPFVKVFGF